MDIITDYESFSNQYNDEYKFWTGCQKFSNSSFYNIYENTIIDNYFLENGGYYLYINSLARLGNYFDGNNIMLQLSGSMILCLLSSCFIFRILLEYTNRDKAVKNTIIFMCFTIFLPLSVHLLRDTMVAFLYSIVFYNILVQKNFIKAIIIHILLIIITSYIRTEHGLFLLAFIPVILYFRSQKYRVVFVIIGILLLILSIPIINNILATYNTTNEEYEKITSAGLGSGLGQMLHSLPTGLKEFALIIQSQIHPFPIYYFIAVSKTVYGGILGSTYLLSSFFWFYIFATSVYGIYKNYNKLPSIIGFMYIISIVFFIANTTNMGARRIMCMYPIIYICYLLTKEITSSNVIYSIKKNVIMFCFSISFIYLLIIMQR